MPFFQKGDVRIRYEEAGSGFPLLVTPGGGLNSRVSNWPTAVINTMEEFKNDFRVITMDQRNATGGDCRDEPDVAHDRVLPRPVQGLGMSYRRELHIASAVRVTNVRASVRGLTR